MKLINHIPYELNVPPKVVWNSQVVHLTFSPSNISISNDSELVVFKVNSWSQYTDTKCVFCFQFMRSIWVFFCLHFFL